ncbi:Predicted membrane protein [Yersinia aldovae]|uniref:DUF805 domain-containing protein n=1 Tax=Yersinia aldovae TaxID=29483 RepID=UPI0005E02870|nr:hypothetical protein [Yersinia aldovae]CNI32845.1 Predicted membrane protein [Yersinia aldovae]
MRFISELFCEVRNGRLSRVRFLVCYIMTFVLPMLLFCFAFAPLFLLFHDTNLSNFVIASFILFAFFIFALLFASANIEAKRFRDMGLPGWGMFIMHLFIGLIINIIFYDYLSVVAFIIHLLIFLFLFLIPTNFFISKA